MNPNHWYPAAFSREVKKGTVIETRFSGEDLAVYRCCVREHSVFSAAHLRQR